MMDTRHERSRPRMAAMALHFVVLLAFFSVETVIYSKKLYTPQADLAGKLEIVHHILSTVVIFNEMCKLTSAPLRAWKAVKRVVTSLTSLGCCDIDPESGPAPGPALARTASVQSPAETWQWREQVSYTSECSGPSLSRQGSTVSGRDHQA